MIYAQFLHGSNHLPWIGKLKSRRLPVLINWNSTLDKQWADKKLNDDFACLFKRAISVACAVSSSGKSNKSPRLMPTKGRERRELLLPNIPSKQMLVIKVAEMHLHMDTTGIINRFLAYNES
jgi:hypothetical protein